jgi:hypothetical protein
MKIIVFMRLVLLCQTSVDLRVKFEPDLGHALQCHTSVDIRFYVFWK